MAKERARRRAERLAVLEKEKAARARKVARRRQRRALVQRLTPRRNRSGRLYKRSRGERIGIVLLPLLAIAAVWLFLPDLGLRIVLTTVIVLAAPALVVVVLGKRA
jgi:Flp pilus assembly protein TadB